MATETITKVFDANVPEEVHLEVRRNMRADGWTFRGTTDEKDRHGQPLKVQHYERETGNLE